MEQPKWLMWSLTAWGAIVTFASTVLPTVGPLIGIDINVMEIAQLGEAGTALLNALGGIIGTGMVIFGRMRAQGPATLTPQ